MISRNNYIKSKGNDGEKEFAVKFEPRKSSLVSKDDEAVIKRVSEFVNDQIGKFLFLLLSSLINPCRCENQTIRRSCQGTISAPGLADATECGLA